jgi:hypothetical protein
VFRCGMPACIAARHTGMIEVNQPNMPPHRIETPCR